VKTDILAIAGVGLLLLLASKAKTASPDIMGADELRHLLAGSNPINPGINPPSNWGGYPPVLGGTQK
jgi:hypothetical protein